MQELYTENSKNKTPPREMKATKYTEMPAVAMGTTQHWQAAVPPRPTDRSIPSASKFQWAVFVEIEELIPEV